MFRTFVIDPESPHISAVLVRKFKALSLKVLHIINGNIGIPKALTSAHRTFTKTSVSVCRHFDVSAHVSNVAVAQPVENTFSKVVLRISISLHEHYQQPVTVRNHNRRYTFKAEGHTCWFAAGIHKLPWHNWFCCHGVGPRVLGRWAQDFLLKKLKSCVRWQHSLAFWFPANRIDQCFASLKS